MFLTRAVTIRRFANLRKFEWPYVCVLLILNLGFFANVWFGGKSVSKLSRIAEWDSVFQDYSTGAATSCDPSLVQLLVPNYFLVAEQWHKFVLPLWNPFSGCGIPLAGDIQATIFSPVRLLLAVFPSVRTYSLILVAEVLIAGLAVFLLARLLRLSGISSLYAAIAYSFCPYFLYYMELLSGTSQVLLPAVCAAFVYSARFGRTVSALFLPSLAAAGYIVSGHPESSLYGMAIASCLFLFVSFKERSASVTKIVFELSLIALWSFCFSAPALLPFLEFLSCGDSYKYGVGISAFAPWQGLFLNLNQPSSGGASPYLGAVTLLLLPLSFFTSKSSRSVVLFLWSMFVVVAVFVARIFPIDLLLAIKPFTYLVTIYLIPAILLFFSLLAGFGLDALVRNCLAKVVWQSVFFKLMQLPLLVCTLLPLALFFFHVDLRSCDFDQTIPSTTLKLRTIFFNAALSITFLALCRLLPRATRWHSSAKVAQLIGIIAVCLNFCSLATAARFSMPVQPTFAYPETPVTKLLQSSHSRVLSVIEHVFKPNVNIVYGISSFRVHNPLLPARFATFAHLCGANLDEFRNQSYSGKLTEMVDLASIKHILTQFKTLPTRYKLLYTSKQGIAIYENARALPEAYLVGHGRKVNSELQARQAILAPSFDARKEVVLESSFTTENQYNSSAVFPLFVPLNAVRKNLNQVAIDYSSPVSAYLVLTDTFYPGWQATIDGQPIEILRANYLFRAIYVPPGTHSVLFEYWPFSLVVGFTLFLFALLAAIVMVVRTLFRRHDVKVGAA